MHSARYYEVPLDLMLAPSTAQTVEAVCNVVKGVLGHLRSEIGSVASPKKGKAPISARPTAT